MHGGSRVGFRDAEQASLLRGALGLRLQRGHRRCVATQNAQSAARERPQRSVFPVLDQLVFAIPQKGEVVGFQPGQELDGGFDRALLDGLRGAAAKLLDDI